MTRTAWRWLAALVAVAAVTLALAGDRLTAGPEERDRPIATGSCPAPVEPPLQDGTHLIGDAQPPVPYSSVPPTSGWHASGSPRTGIVPADDPLTDPELVLTIEVGQVVAAYDPARLHADEVAELERLATGPHAGSLTVTPYEGAEAPLSLVAWGVLQSCQEVQPDVVDAFVGAYADPDADAH